MSIIHYPDLGFMHFMNYTNVEEKGLLRLMSSMQD